MKQPPKNLYPTDAPSGASSSASSGTSTGTSADETHPAAANLPHVDFRKGHRSRLRRRLMKYPASLSDEEILETLLFYILPRRDVKPLASQILAKFGSLARIFHAEDQQLQPYLSENGIALFKALGELFSRIHKPQHKSLMLAGWQQMIKYCQAKMANEHVEKLLLLIFNAKNELVFEEVIQTGTLNHVTIYQREILKTALLFNAASIVLVHNHPGGGCEPSKEDIKATMLLKDLMHQSGINLHDHLIVAPNSHYSMRNEGLFEF